MPSETAATLPAYIPGRGLCLGKNVCHCEVQINTVFVNLTNTSRHSFFFFFFYRIKLISLTFEAVNEGLAEVVETEELCSGWTHKTSFCGGSHLAFIASTFFWLFNCLLSVAAIHSLPSPGHICVPASPSSTHTPRPNTSNTLL